MSSADHSEQFESIVLDFVIAYWFHAQLYISYLLFIKNMFSYFYHL